MTFASRGFVYALALPILAGSLSIAAPETGHAQTRASDQTFYKQQQQRALQRQQTNARITNTWIQQKQYNATRPATRIQARPQPTYKPRATYKPPAPSYRPPAPAYKPPPPRPVTTTYTRKR